MLMRIVWMVVMKRNVTVAVRKHTYGQACNARNMGAFSSLCIIHSTFLLCHHRVSVGRHCPLDEFQCNNTLCKPLGWKCDGEDDCGDNSDENPEECGENLCVLVTVWTLSLTQDLLECGLLSSLMFLTLCLLVKFQCPPTRQFRCYNDRVCLPLSKHCDGVNNCGDNSDEVNCREFY